jgi:hypothetical protein
MKVLTNKSIIDKNGKVEQFKAPIVIKTDTSIIGYDTNNKEVFDFRDIVDFSGFTLTNEDGTTVEYDTAQPTVAELQTQIYNLTTALVKGGLM